jgi:hypothetical protein
VFGPVSRPHLLDYLRDELRWGVENADQRYAVLNTCRSVAYARSGRLLSKVDGGAWWLEELGEQTLVEEALTAQREGRDLGPCTPAARGFVAEGVASL